MLTLRRVVHTLSMLPMPTTPSTLSQFKMLLIPFPDPQCHRVWLIEPVPAFGPARTTIGADADLQLPADTLQPSSLRGTVPPRWWTPHRFRPIRRDRAPLARELSDGTGRFTVVGGKIRILHVHRP